MECLLQFNISIALIITVIMHLFVFLSLPLPKWSRQMVTHLDSEISAFKKKCSFYSPLSLRACMWGNATSLQF